MDARGLMLLFGTLPQAARSASITWWLCGAFSRLVYLFSAVLEMRTPLRQGRLGFPRMIEASFVPS